tara:strand:- start:134790 stop:134972 length:183 start_codon:yes stop_codon:yes gene_type:complete
MIHPLVKFLIIVALVTLANAFPPAAVFVKWALVVYSVIDIALLINDIHRYFNGKSTWKPA